MAALKVGRRLNRPYQDDIIAQSNARTFDLNRCATRTSCRHSPQLPL